jgi:hypothetical protein
MKLDTPSFRGMVPRLTPRALPDNGSQNAVNCRLVSGDLEAWNQFAETERLGITPMTIYRLNGAWLTWATDVDVARGIIPGDDTFRIYLTGPDEYSTPRWTNYALAVSSPGGHPAQTRPLGVPNPDSVPTLSVGIDPTSTTFGVNVFDAGDDLATNWTVSDDSGSGFDYASRAIQYTNSASDPAYQIVIENNAGTPAYAYRNFGVASAAAAQMSVDFEIDPAQGDDGIVVEIGLGMTPQGAGPRLVVSSSIGSPVMLLYKGSEWGIRSELARVNVGSALTRGVRYTLVLLRVLNADRTYTLTGTLYQGSGQLQTITEVNTFDDGDLGALIGVTGDDPKSTFYRNILVTASGTTGYVPTNLTTSYVFTFVNDVGEESGPSLPSSTITRPDGVSVAVTTPTDAPTGTSSEYGITLKRIYRAATGNTGTVFRFVAEIPLTQAIYDDVLTDAQLGEVLETELFALPPDDLRGIIALPNGIMAGFRRNQLCLSARNHPHAWPVEYRLNTDTDIVGIANIDSTIVIGTESFPYLAGGNDPSAFSMTKLEVPQACVAKRSFAYLTNIGVVFASPDGLIAVAGTGQVRNLTETVFTRRQWQALEPTTILGVAHDDVYHFWFGTIASEVAPGWNTTNESGAWTFTNADFTAEATP